MVTKTTMSLALMLSVALSQAQGTEVPVMKPSHLKALKLLQEKKALAEIDDIDMKEATLEFLSGTVRKKSAEEGLLLYDKEGFLVRKDDEDVRVHRYDTDKLFHGRSVKEMTKYAIKGNKLKLTKLDNGEYTVQAQGELKGGGPILAACIGISVRVGGYGAWGVGALTIPGFIGTWPAAAAVIENTANYGTAAALLTPSL